MAKSPFKRQPSTKQEPAPVDRPGGSSSEVNALRESTQSEPPKLSAEERRIRHQQNMTKAHETLGITETDLSAPQAQELIRPVTGKKYIINKGPSWKWWTRLFNMDPATVVIEGTFQEVIGAPFLHPTVNSHYLVMQFRQRRRDIGRGYPIHRDDDIYVARIRDRRVLVHAAELAHLPN